MAKGLQEFKADVKANAELAGKFKGLKSVDEIVAKAKSEGYTFSPEDIESLSNVSADDLAKAAGGEGPQDAVIFTSNFMGWD